MPQRLNHPSSQLWKNLNVAVKQLRRNQTEAEALLWKLLRDRKLRGYKFRRQHAIHRFIVDFYCAQAGLIIELDGPIHAGQVEEDQERQRFLEDMGFRVERFSNDSVLNDPELVLDQIIIMLNVASK